MSKDRIGNLAIIISGDAKNYMEVMAGVEQHLAAAQARMEAKSRNSEINPIASYAKGAVAAYVTGQLGHEMLEVGKNAIQLARDLEVSEKQLKVLTGSAANAREVMADLRNFAATTPFDLGEISSVARKLMGGGMGQGDSLRATKQIAAVGAGTGGELASLGRAYSQVMANGRFMTEELNQFSDADFPIAEFAKTYGKTMGQLRDDMSKGIVPVSVMADTFTRLTEEGGKFATTFKEMNDTGTGRAKREKAAQDAYLAESGAKLEAMGATGRQVGDWWERRLVDLQTFTARGVANAMHPGAGEIDLSIAKKIQEENETARQQHDAYVDSVRRRVESEMKLQAAFDNLPEAMRAITEEVKAFFEVRNGSPFRRGGAPAWASDHSGLRKAMEWGDYKSAAQIVMDRQDQLSQQRRFRFAPALQRGTAEAESAIANAIESSMSSQVSIEDAINDLNTTAKEQKDRLDKAVEHLKILTDRKPQQARF